MSYAKILAPLVGMTRDGKVLAAAFAAARPFHAHVQVLFVRPDPTESMPFFGEGMSGLVVQEIIDAAKQAADEAAGRARETLAQVVADTGVTMVDEPVRRDTVTVSWHEIEGDFVARVAQASRLSDLVVFGPLPPEEKPGLTEAFEATLLETGRPVVLGAQTPIGNFARRIAIGWDASVPCARSVTAAMPYLEQAEQVEILTVCQGTVQDDAADVCDYLALHGVRAVQRSVDAGQQPVGAVLLEAAVGGGADLLVLGGYGHTRLRQMFFGGVTRHVVSHAELPLFLVH